MANDVEQSLRTINLNMLPALRAILKHRNLTRAAEELNVTQAAVSNSLRRLRDHFGDDLVIRDGRRMRLSAKAMQLVEPLEAALSAIRAVLATEPFDPARSPRRFVVATANNLTAIVMPAVANILAAEAPGVSIQVVTASARSAHDLRTERIDLIVSPRQIAMAPPVSMGGPGDAFSHEPLLKVPFVCLGRRDDASLDDGLTREHYLARAHASFALDLDFHASLERAHLDEHRIAQFDRLVASDFLVLPLIVAQTDCLALVPRNLARLACRLLPLRMLPSPIPVPPLDLIAIWNRRRDADAEIVWLRHIVRRAIA